jgi:hypothetical protein
MMRILIAALSIVAFTLGCSESPSHIASPGAPSVVAPAPTPTAAANGSVVWTEIRGSRTLCSEITRQVGHRYPLWLSIRSEGGSVTLSLFHEGPPDGNPLADPPGVFTGSRSGNEIRAVYSGPMGGMACPTDRSITPQTGGDLSATVSGDRISGEYTEIYGSAADQVTFVFRFEASFASS